MEFLTVFSKIGVGGDKITRKIVSLVISSIVDFITDGLLDFSFPALTNKTKEEGKKGLYFERLIVGMPNESLIGIEIGDNTTMVKHKIGMIQLMKDKLWRLCLFNK